MLPVIAFFWLMIKDIGWAYAALVIIITLGALLALMFAAWCIVSD